MQFIRRESIHYHILKTENYHLEASNSMPITTWERAGLRELPYGGKRLFLSVREFFSLFSTPMYLSSTPTINVITYIFMRNLPLSRFWHYSLETPYTETCLRIKHLLLIITSAGAVWLLTYFLSIFHEVFPVYQTVEIVDFSQRWTINNTKYAKGAISLA